MAPSELLIAGARVCAPAGVWDEGWLRTDGPVIAGLGPGDPGDPAAAAVAGPQVERIAASGMTLVPGFVDVHVHGGAGTDVMDADLDGLRALARFHATCGTTALVATTWAASEAATADAVAAVAAVTGPVDGGATILGVHLEGPWINPARAGAQDRTHLRLPSVDEAERLLESGAVRIVTLAPELDGAGAVIATCRERGAVVAAGHTEASYDEMAAAARAGVRHVTHTYNAMAGFGHRQPGTVGAALALPDLRCELIADGVHVHPAAMAVLARAKGTEGVVLVTDATRAAGMPDGPVDLGGRRGVCCGGAVRLADGTLAGSTLTMDAAVRTFARASDWGWDRLWRAASANAADTLGLATKGRLVAGADADLVLLDAAGGVVLTVAGGRIVYRRPWPDVS
ncbi:MAG: N-acetylglucosamine-6-phosphate deacetylase [Acidimicrobiia bacterium]